MAVDMVGASAIPKSELMPAYRDLIGREATVADLYAAICKENGLSSSMVEKYCPEVFEKLFPG